MRTDVPVWVVPREGLQYQGRRAGLVTRSIAGVIDGVVVVVAVLAGYVGVNGLRFLIDPRSMFFAVPNA